MKCRFQRRKIKNIPNGTSLEEKINICPPPNPPLRHYVLLSVKQLISVRISTRHLSNTETEPTVNIVFCR
jgi:hypothetical protein